MDVDMQLRDVYWKQHEGICKALTISLTVNRVRHPYLQSAPSKPQIQSLFRVGVICSWYGCLMIGNLILTCLTEFNSTFADRGVVGYRR